MRMIFAFKECGSQSKKRIFSFKEIIRWIGARQTREVRINGEPYALNGRPYTTSDDGRCTRFNLFNEWVTKLPEDARVLYGPNIGISPTVIDRNDEAVSRIERIEVTFRYYPKTDGK